MKANVRGSVTVTVRVRVRVTRYTEDLLALGARCLSSPEMRFFAR